MAEIDIPAAARRFRDVVQSHHRFWVSVHESPDGDSIGAALALQDALGRLGKRVVAIRQHHCCFCSSARCTARRRSSRSPAPSCRCCSRST